MCEYCNKITTMLKQDDYVRRMGETLIIVFSIQFGFIDYNV